MNYNEYLNVKSNEIFWLIQALKEQIQLEEKVCSPIYRYIGIVFSNEFMNYEMSIKNVKKILQTILNKYDFLLKKKAMKKINILYLIMPYIFRIEKNLNLGLINIINLKNLMKNKIPPEMIYIISTRKETINLLLKIKNNLMFLNKN